MANRIALDNDYPPIAASQKLWERAKDLIPAGTQTLAKGPGQYVDGVAPKYATRGKGAHVWDLDGNEYIDFNMAIGPVSLGYAYEAVDRAIRAQLEAGITFSLVHPLEVEVAELVREVVPCAEAVRFSKTGCDATTAAVRLARAFTGKKKVVCCGYHGWHDWYIAVTDRSAGIPDEVKALSFTFSYNDLQSAADAIDDETACVILEPMVFEAPRPGFLEGLKQLCEDRGVLLVFDEMWTGFRWALGGAQEAYGVTPHLATFSKAMANGMPISVVCGRADVMRLCEKDVFFFTTFGGEALSLAAAQATIHELRDKKVPEHLQRMGKLLRDGLDATLKELSIDWVKCIGHDARTLVTFDAKAGDPLHQKSLVQQELIKRGVLWSGFHTLCYSHGMDEIGYLLAAYRQVLPILADAVATKDVAGRLRGKPVEPVFRRTSQFNMKPVRNR